MAKDKKNEAGFIFSEPGQGQNAQMKSKGSLEF